MMVMIMMILWRLAACATHSFSVGLGLSDSRVAVATFLSAIPVNRTPVYAHVVKLWQSLSSRLQLRRVILRRGRCFYFCLP